MCCVNEGAAVSRGPGNEAAATDGVGAASRSPRYTSMTRFVSAYGSAARLLHMIAIVMLAEGTALNSARYPPEVPPCRTIGSAGRVIPKPRIEVRKLDRMIEQMIQRTLEGLREQQPRQVNGQQARMRFDVRGARHADTRRGGNDAAHFPAHHTASTSRSVSTSRCCATFSTVSFGISQSDLRDHHFDAPPRSDPDVVYVISDPHLTRPRARAFLYSTRR